jgi:hypothetical protein
MARREPAQKNAEKTPDFWHRLALILRDFRQAWRPKVAKPIKRKRKAG